MPYSAMPRIKLDMSTEAKSAIIAYTTYVMTAGKFKEQRCSNFQEITILYMEVQGLMSRTPPVQECAHRGHSLSSLDAP